MFILEVSLGVIGATIVAFLVLILLLVALLLFTKEKLSPSGPVTITINGEKEIEVPSGSTLLSTLGNQKIFLPSACGGGGSAATGVKNLIMMRFGMQDEDENGIS